MEEKLPFSKYLVIGVMLFALFFGAGNLIFPAALGQNAGANIWPAISGFLITGVGLPFLGILAMGYSGSRNLQELSGRVHPIYGIIFTSVLYLTIGPFFAAPRTGAVAYDIGIAPFVGGGYERIALVIFTFIFFAITLWLSLNPAKLVDRIGKILAPGIFILLFILLTMVIVKPMGAVGVVQEEYVSGAFMKGFTEGYNTMDALASLVFGIIVIKAIRALGVKSTRGVLSATIKSGIVATVSLGVIYVGVAYLGATSTERFGIFENGGPVLSSASSYYFGTIGAVMLSIVIFLACLTTSIGLMTSCGEYFNTLLPKISYQAFVVIFTTFCFIVANIGLSNIIMYSVPVLMFLYPLAIVLIFLTFLSPLFNHAQLVYIAAIITTLMISTIDGLKEFCKSFEMEYFNWMKPVIRFYENKLPLYEDGLGWLLPVVVVIVITAIIARIFKLSAAQNTKKPVAH